MLSVGSEEDIEKMLADNELDGISDGTYYIVSGKDAVVTNNIVLLHVLVFL